VVGDCGSWVIDARTGSVYGHVIAGHPGSRVAYITPAYQVYGDIRNRVSDDVELLTAKNSPTGDLAWHGLTSPPASLCRNQISMETPYTSPVANITKPHASLPSNQIADMDSIDTRTVRTVSSDYSFSQIGRSGGDPLLPLGEPIPQEVCNYGSSSGLSTVLRNRFQQTLDGNGSGSSGIIAPGAITPSIETLEYYYERASSDGIDYWALKEEYLSFNYQRSYIIGPT
jgi:hypothetical protein